jgi:cytochrome c oxidase subunit 2
MELIIEQASSFASDIDFIILVIVILGGFWLFVAEFVFFYFLYKYRRSNNPKAAYITGEKHSEKKWIHWPHYMVIACDIFIIFFAIKAWYNVKQDLPPADDTVRIVGQQWAWTFVHSGPDKQLGTFDDITTVDELHLKKGLVYHFKLESKDVLHSFSVPVFRLKQDAVPGRVITGWFKPTKSGTFDVQCAEMCGIGHGAMAAKVHIHTDSDYTYWENKQTKGHAQKKLNQQTANLANNKSGDL